MFLGGIYIKTSGDVCVEKANPWKVSVDRNSLNT
jgi:hypothetical protein